MAWGDNGNIILDNLDDSADDPSLARLDILAALQELQAVISGRNEVNGVCPLDSAGLVPAANIPDTLITDVGNNLLLNPDTGRVAVQDILNLSIKTVTEISSVSAVEGDIMYCSNGDAGDPCLAVYNGTDWLRVALGAAISAT